MPDGTPLPRGQSRLSMPDGGYDAALDLVGSILEDPSNSFMFPAEPPWTDPMKLLEALIGLYNSVGLDMSVIRPNSDNYLPSDASCTCKQCTCSQHHFQIQNTHCTSSRLIHLPKWYAHILIIPHLLYELKIACANRSDISTPSSGSTAGLKSMGQSGMHHNRCLMLFGAE